jgi:hypothetical protein
MQMLRRVPVALLAILSVLILPATIAAAQPQLVATVVPGTEISVVGSGFPASADVTLVIHRSNHPDETRTLRSDAAGSFTTTIDAGPGRGGAYALVATAGASTATVDVVAVETAGGSGGGIRPPATDTQPRSGPDRATSIAPITEVLVVLVAGALGGLWALRRTRNAAA